jgi:hypothetical protein
MDDHVALNIELQDWYIDGVDRLSVKAQHKENFDILHITFEEQQLPNGVKRSLPKGTSLYWASGLYIPEGGFWGRTQDFLVPLRKLVQFLCPNHHVTVRWAFDPGFDHGSYYRVGIYPKDR